MVFILYSGFIVFYWHNQRNENKIIIILFLAKTSNLQNYKFTTGTHLVCTARCRARCTVTVRIRTAPDHCRCFDFSALKLPNHVLEVLLASHPSQKIWISPHFTDKVWQTSVVSPQPPRCVCKHPWYFSTHRVRVRVCVSPTACSPLWTVMLVSVKVRMYWMASRLQWRLCKGLQSEYIYLYYVMQSIILCILENYLRGIVLWRRDGPGDCSVTQQGTYDVARDQHGHVGGDTAGICVENWLLIILINIGFGILTEVCFDLSEHVLRENEGIHHDWNPSLNIILFLLWALGNNTPSKDTKKVQTGIMSDPSYLLILGSRPSRGWGSGQQKQTAYCVKKYAGQWSLCCFYAV